MITYETKDEIEIDGITYTAQDAIKDASCFGCAFEDTHIACGEAIKQSSCCGVHRTDEREVIWIEATPKL